MTAFHDDRAFVEIAWDPKVAAFLSAALGAEKFRSIQAAIAVPPLSTCLRVNTLKTTVQAVLQQLQAALPPQEGHSCAPHPQVPVAIMLQGSGPNTIYPQAAGVTKQVVISRKAGEAVLRGAQVFVPGVLAVSSGLSAGDLVAVMVALDAPGSPHSGITRGTILPAQTGSGSSSSSDASAPQCTAAVRQPAAAAVQPITTGDHLASATGAANHSAAAAAADLAAAAAASKPFAAAGGLLCIGLGRAQMGRVEIFREQHGVAVKLEQRVYDVPSPSIEGHLKGSVMLQNLPSIVAAMVLNPKPGSRVLDMCAAPGGKTTMLAQIMAGKGTVVALDRSHAKVDDIKALAAELGCAECVEALKMDSTKAVAKQSALDPLYEQRQQQQQHSQQNGLELLQQQQQQQGAEQVPLASSMQQQPEHPDFNTAGLSAKSLARLQRRTAAMLARGQQPPAAEYRLYGLGPAKHPGFPPESFDAVLLDAPCTALGLRPRLLQQHTLQLLLDTAAYQRALLAAAVQLLKPGGALVYSTCTISPAENEINVRHALDTYPCLQLVPAEPRIGGPGLTGPADKQAMAAAAAAAAGHTCRTAAAAATVAGAEVAAAAEGGDAAVAAAAAATSGRVCRFDVDECSREWLTQAEANMVQRFDPAGPADTIGFFVAKFIKTCSMLA